MTSIIEIKKFFISLGLERPLADAVYSYLNEKYYWRDWLIVSYSNPSVSNIHFTKACDEGRTTVVKRRYKNMNLLVSSIAKDTIQSRFSGNVHGYKTTTTRYWNRRYWVTRTIYTPYKAEQIYNNMPVSVKNCKYPLVGSVIRSDDIRLVIRAPSSRKFLRNVNTKAQECKRVGPRRECKDIYYHVFVLG